MTRQTKTPRQRAEEALALAGRAVERLEQKVTRLREDHAAAVHELEDAQRRRDYLAANPDLPQPTDTTTQGATS